MDNPIFSVDQVRENNYFTVIYFEKLFESLKSRGKYIEAQYLKMSIDYFVKADGYLHMIQRRIKL